MKQKRGVLFLLVLLFLPLMVGLVVALPPEPPSEPNLSPNNCSWNVSAEICDGIDNDCNGLIDDGIICDDEEDTGDDGGDTSGASSSSSGGFVLNEEPEENESENESFTSDDAQVANSTNLSDEERKAEETKKILQDMNLSEQPKFTKNPGKTVVFWSKKIFFYGGLSLLLFLIGLLILFSSLDKTRRKHLAKHEKTVHSSHQRVLAKKSMTEQQAEKKAIDYVLHMQKKGFGDEVIKKNLRDVGWKTEDIQKLFDVKSKE